MQYGLHELFERDISVFETRASTRGIGVGGHRVCHSWSIGILQGGRAARGQGNIASVADVIVSRNEIYID